MQSAESLGVGLEQFFQSTLVKNGRGIREDVKAPVPIFGTGRYELPNLIGDYATNYNGLLYGQWFHNYTLPVPTQFSLSPPPSEEHTSSPWEIIRQLFWDNRDYFLQFGNEITLPGMSFSFPYVTQLPPNIITCEGERPRGTGTYIPDMVILILMPLNFSFALNISHNLLKEPTTTMVTLLITKYILSHCRRTFLTKVDMNCLG